VRQCQPASQLRGAMSRSIDLPEAPAFLYAGRDSVVYMPADAETCALIEVIAPGFSSADRLTATRAAPPAGHYRVKLANGDRSFVRILPDTRLQQCRDTHDLIASLNSGAPVVRPEPPIALGAGYIGVVSAWHDHGLPGEHTDTRAIGMAMAQMHMALEDVPSMLLKQRSRERRSKFAHRLSQPLPSRAIEITRRLPSPLESLDDLTGQALHGDCNPGNILLCANEILFCDFENSAHAWGPPIFDLATVVERLCLPHANALERAALLLASWQTVSGRSAVARTGALLDAISTRNLMAVAVLCLLDDRGTPAHDSEWAKFEGLAHQITDCLPLIEAIEQEVMG